MLKIMDIREQVPLDVLDYQQLVSILRGYAKPRDRISALLADGDLVRVRKGLYVFGKRYCRAPLSRELLANLIYGPSYVSLDYALGHYGMIPERVADVTSITAGENRRFTTPFGVFSYHSLSPQRYAPGIQWAGEGDGRYLMASPEKALVDKVWTDKRICPTSPGDFDAYLFEDLRLDEPRLARLSYDRIASIAHAFATKKINLLLRWVAQRTGGRQ